MLNMITRHKTLVFSFNHCHNLQILFIVKARSNVCGTVGSLGDYVPHIDLASVLKVSDHCETLHFPSTIPSTKYPESLAHCSFINTPHLWQNP